jgi:hypothetical protein
MPKTISDKNIERLAPNNQFIRENAIELACEFFTFEGMTYGKDGGELETIEELENKAIKYLISAGFELIN